MNIDSDSSLLGSTIREWQQNCEEDYYDVSAIVVAYNSTWEAEAATLDSILMQRDVRFEIIVADDGSKNNNFDLVSDYFKKHNFTDFKLVDNKINRGTVYNVYSALSIAKGKYVKTISPGDMFYKNDTLKKWLAFMHTYDIEWSFSDVIPYKNVDGAIVPIVTNISPNNISLYKKGSQKDVRWQYFVLSDWPVGASMMCLRTLQLKYIEEILNKVIYMEDNIWRLMMFDGIVGKYFSAYTVLYEYGSGISTSKNKNWEERLRNDWKNADKILTNRKGLDNFQLEMLKAYYNTKGRFKKIFVRGKLKNKLFYSNRKSFDYLP